ncbi:MAG: GGDEF domain-containing protein, partial [Pseudomonadota bacterium]
MIARARTGLAQLPLALSRLPGLLRGPQALAFLPALSLASFWLGGELALIATALTVPLIIALSGMVEAQRKEGAPRAVQNGLSARNALIYALDGALGDDASDARTSICFAVEIDELKTLEERYGRKAGERIIEKTGERLADCLRDYDVITRVDPATFAIAISPMRNCDLEVAIQMASRVQAAVETPISVDATSVYIATSIGFCLSSRAPSARGEAMLDAALVAMVEARRNGPSAIRA